MTPYRLSLLAYLDALAPALRRAMDTCHRSQTRGIFHAQEVIDDLLDARSLLAQMEVEIRHPSVKETP